MPFANVRERSLQLVRHVSQESTALLRQVEEAAAQPLELPADALQILRTGHSDRT